MAATRLRLKNAASNSIRLFSSPAALIQRPWTHFANDSDVSDDENTVYKKALKLQRPTTIKYEDISPNFVSLIGAIDRPFGQCNCTRFGVHTTVRLYQHTTVRPYQNLSVMLKFWDEKAEMSVQHLRPNDLVYVAGCLGSYTMVDENEKSIRFYEVVVSEVNFVSRNGLEPAYQNLVMLDPEVSIKEIKQKRRDHLHLWQIFFASPFEWWDNRNRKLNRKMPDFKHNDTGEVLWVKDNDPPWVHKQLQLHDLRLYRRYPDDTEMLRHICPLWFMNDAQET